MAPRRRLVRRGLHHLSAIYEQQFRGAWIQHQFKPSSPRSPPHRHTACPPRNTQTQCWPASFSSAGGTCVWGTCGAQPPPRRRQRHLQASKTPAPSHDNTHSATSPRTRLADPPLASNRPTNQPLQNVQLPRVCPFAPKPDTHGLATGHMRPTSIQYKADHHITWLNAEMARSCWRCMHLRRCVVPSAAQVSTCWRDAAAE